MLSRIICESTLSARPHIRQSMLLRICPELGTLNIGSCADITVLHMEKGNFGFADSGHARLKGNLRLNCVLTVRAGKVVYDPDAICCPDWKTAPAPYWVAPGVLQ